MTYNPLKPDQGPSPQIDVSTIQNNFLTFSTIFSSTVGGVNYNHTALNNKFQGDHESVILQTQSGGAQNPDGQTTLYGKNAGSNAGTQPQLFVKVPQFLPTSLDTKIASNAGMQLTYNTVNTSGSPNYQSFLAGGYIFYFGNVNTNSILYQVNLTPVPSKLLIAIASQNTIFYTTGIGATNLPFNINTTIPNGINSYFFISTPLAFNPPAGGYNFSWLAIGAA